MIDVALPAMVIALAALAWHSALAAREAARTHAAILCRRADLQLLDDTVALARLKPRRDRDRGWLLERRYRFEVSSTGADRLPAELLLVGGELAGYHLPEIATGPSAGSAVTRLPNTG